MTHVYRATLSRDDEAGVWYVSDTNVPGLATEADTLPQLLAKLRHLVPELLQLNRHLLEDQP